MAANRPNFRTLANLPVVLLSRHGGVADARQVSDAAMSATVNPTVLTSATAAFTQADVGKVIRVSGAGGVNAKLATTIASVQSATQATLAAPAIATVSAHGATWGTDAGPALQAALDAIGAAGGGTVLIDGRYLVASAVTKNFNNLAASLRIEGTGGAGRLYIACPAADRAISVQNLTQFVCDGVTFVGTPNERNDAKAALHGSGVHQWTVRDCGLFGLACVDTAGGAVVHAQGSDLRLRHTFFGGCTGSAGNGLSVVLNETWIGFSAEEGCQFIDYGILDGVEHTKTPIDAAYAWIRATDVAAGVPANARSQGVFRVRDCRFDEGAIYHVLLNPAGRIKMAEFDGVYANPSAAGKGLFLNSVDYVTIRNSWFGYIASGTPEAVNVTGCYDVTIEDVETAANVDRIRAYFVTRLNLARVNAGTLSAETVTTLTERDCDITTRTLTGVTNYNRLVNGQGGVWALTKAGAVSDADFAVAPPIGTMAFDTTNNRIYVKRAAATWVSSAALT